MIWKARLGRAWSNRELLTVPPEPIEAEWRAPIRDIDGLGHESPVASGRRKPADWLSTSTGGCMRRYCSAVEGKDVHAA